MSAFNALPRKASRFFAGVALLLMAHIPNAFADLVVSGTRVLYYNETTGAFLGVLLPTGGYNAMATGPDGNLYLISVNAAGSGSIPILRYDGRSVETFVPAGSGGLGVPTDLKFGPDGNLYVADTSGGTNSILRFNGKTGEFMNVFASGGGMDYPSRIAFAPNGDLYAGNSRTNSDVLRYHAGTGLPYPAPGYGGAIFIQGVPDSSISALAVAPNGTVFANTTIFAISRYDGMTGAFLGELPSTDLSVNMAVGPDGNLYIIHRMDNAVHRYSSTSGEFLDRIGGGPLQSPRSLTFACVSQHGLLKLKRCNNAEQNRNSTDSIEGSALLPPF